MTGERSTGAATDVGPAGRSSRPVTRRRFVAAATAVASLGTVGLLSGGNDAGGRADERAVAAAAGDGTPSSTHVESATPPAESATEAHAADSDADERATVDAPVLGANLNGRPRRLLNRFELIDASDTKWVRAFLDVRKKLAAGTPPERDPDVLALRRAARERDCKLIVSLKWDFKANWGDKKPMRVPPADSRYERELCRCAARYLAAIDAPVDIVVLGNEPMWETLPADIGVADSPLLRFTRTAKEHLVRHGDHGDPSYLVGAFNRLHDDRIRERRFGHFCRETFEMVREDEDVEGVDLHLHYDVLAEAEEMLTVARAELPDGTLTVTEFSPMLRYARHVHDPLSASTAGERFALDRGLPPEMTAVEYFEYAKRNPRSPEELADFYDAMPWYNADHVEDIYALFSEFGVSVGTFGLLQGEGMRNEDWTTGWQPFHINFLFQPALLRADRGIEHTAHPRYIDDYRRRTERD